MYYTVKQFAQLINKSPQTIRNWDKLGTLKPEIRGKDNHYRYYTFDQAKPFLLLNQITGRKLDEKVLICTDRDFTKESQKKYHILTVTSGKNLIIQVVKAIHNGNYEKVVFIGDYLLKGGFRNLDTFMNELLNNLGIEMLIKGELENV